MTSDVVVTDIPDAHRYEARDPGGELLAFTEYDLIGHTVVFVHTVTAPEHEGKGFASRLVQAALDDVRARGRDVVAVCPYVKAWIARHSDYQDLLRPARDQG